MPSRTRAGTSPAASSRSRPRAARRDGSANLLYGPGSSAWSGTLTATYQSGVFFTRAEISVVGVSDATAGAEFGTSGTSSSQTRFAVETGILF